MIDKFRDKFYFLSNFYSCKINYNGHIFQNAEAAFQAQKDLSRVEEFIDLNPVKAKHLGKKVKLRADWNQVKLAIMKNIVRAKFTQNKDLADKLINTYDEKLVEGNAWHDYFWGVCNNKGQNHLGIILMEIREELTKAKLNG